MEVFSCQFEKCCEKYSDNNAILYCDNNKIITKFQYKQVNIIADYIKELLERYVEPNSCIGVATITNPLLPLVIIGIHKHNSCFHCIDIGASEHKKLDLFLEQLKLQWILQSSTPYFENNFLEKYANLVETISLYDNHELKLWKLNGVTEKIIYDGISYVIQTSGTTGQNKVVKVTHNCIMSNIESFRKEFEIISSDIIYIGTPITFDPFIIELFLALTTGACLLIVPPRIKTNKTLLLETLFPKNDLHSGVTFLQMPPSVFLTFPEEKIKDLIQEKSTLRTLALGGENFPEQILKYLNKESDLKIFNLYGITEVSCWASIQEICSSEEINLGEPLSDTMLEVRDEEGKVVQEGQGEMFIGSIIRKCQIDNEKLSPSSNILYRATGDIVLVRNKKYFYIGRKDSIIKRFGTRICLLEIEKLICQNTELKSICIWDEQNSKLVLFVILNETDKIVQNKIIDKLRIKFLHFLNKFQNPDYIEIIPNIPLTQNGKTDLDCLLKIYRNNFYNYSNLNPLEIIQNLFSKYFGFSRHQLNEIKYCSFSEIGGNSILAIQITSEFEKFIVSKNYSADLIAILLDNQKSYLDFSSFVQNIKINSVACKRKLEIEQVQSSKCFKTADEKFVQFVIKWKHDLKACVDYSPLYVEHPDLGGIVMVGSHSHIFVVLNNLGQVISEVTLPDAIETSPCISECKKLAILGCNDGYMYCISLKNANILWKYQTNSAIKSTPILCCNETCIAFGSYDKIFYCVTIKDGSLLWKSHISEIVKSTPILNGQKIFITTLQGSCLGLDEKTGEILLRCESNEPIFGSPCIYKNNIIWTNVKGHFFVRNLEDFEMIKNYKANGFIFSSLCLIKDYVLFGCHDHNIYGLKYPDYQEVFKINIGDRISSTPCGCVVKNEDCFVVASNAGKLNLFSLESQVLLDSLQLPNEVFSSPVINGNNVYVGCRDNCVYCIEMKTE